MRRFVLIALIPLFLGGWAVAQQQADQNRAALDKTISYAKSIGVPNDSLKPILLQEQTLIATHAPLALFNAASATTYYNNITIRYQQLEIQTEGTIQLEGPGAVVEWAVKMERLPEEATLRERLLRGEVSREMIETLARKVAAFRADAEAVPHCVRVALSELLLSGVTTLADLSMAHPGWLDLLAEAGMRVCIAPMFRSGRWYTKNGHMVEYAWDEAAGEKAMGEASSLIERAEQHPSGRLFGMVVPAQIDTCTEGLLRESFAEAKARGK